MYTATLVLLHDVKSKKKPITGLDRPWQFQEVKGPIGTWSWQGCKPYAPAAFTPQETFLVLIFVRGWIKPQGHSAAGRIMPMKNFNDTIGNRTHDFSTCSAVPQPNALPRAPTVWRARGNLLLPATCPWPELHESDIHSTTILILSSLLFLRLVGLMVKINAPWRVKP
jgi:hypothetical protein